MKLHEIEKGIEIYVAKLTSKPGNLSNLKLDKLRFKRYVTKEKKAYFAEQTAGVSKTNFVKYRKNPYNNLSANIADIILNGDKVTIGFDGQWGDPIKYTIVVEDNYVAIVDQANMNFYCNIRD